MIPRLPNKLEQAALTLLTNGVKVVEFVVECEGGKVRKVINVSDLETTSGAALFIEVLDSLSKQVDRA